MSISKKVICIIMSFIFAFSFSACSGNGKEETTSVPASEFPIDKLTEAHLSGNGAVYDTCVSELVNERYIMTHAKVYEVESRTRVRCGYSLYDDDWPLHYNAFTLELPEPHNAIEGQHEILLTLQKDDIIVFEGVLKDILIRKSPLGDEWVSLDFSDVVIKSVNGTEV